MMLRRHLAVIAWVCLFAGCGIIPLRGEQNNLLEEDEHRLWLTVEAEEQRLDQSGLLLTDQAVNDYLNSVLRQLSPPESTPDILTVEVRVLKNPLLNAFAFPNGKIYIHTGLLARIENEAQLATLLGHELTHATHRHTIQELRGVRRGSAVLATLQMIVLPLGVLGSVATSLGAVGYMGAVSGYSQGKELEADEEGLGLMVKAGYSPREATKLFEHLKEELVFRKVDEPFFFGSHPRVQERIDSYHHLIETKYAGQRGEEGVDRYNAVISPLVIDNAETDLAIGRLALVLRDLERLVSRQSDNARAHFLLGEVFRQRKEPGDAERSDSHYNRAIEANPRLPEPHRSLGYSFLKRGDRQSAMAELRKYLELAPHAPDRAYVEQAIKESL
ncbi:MAG: M48 family metalloprotease [Nitrospira sp.]|nr:M48 family metalloprotease [Nitrospira sp.]